MIAVDTSVAVPLLVEDHEAHEAVHRWRTGRDLTLCGHTLVETYSVLTRLPGGARLSPEHAAQLIAARFGQPIALSAETSRTLPVVLASLGVAGGAVYDAMVALAAAEENVVLATRDERARATYDAIGVTVEIVE